MSKRNRGLIRIFILALLGAVVAIATGIVINFLTSDPTWQALFSKENRWRWVLLIGLAILTGLLALVNQTNDSEAAQQDQSAQDTALQPPLPDQEARNRQAFLDKVRNAWIDGVLNRSLYSKARIALGMEERPDSASLGNGV